MDCLNIFIYDEPRDESLDVQSVAAYVAGAVPWARVEVREDFLLRACLRDPGAADELARGTASLRIRDHSRPLSRRQPLAAEISFERRRLLDHLVKAFGLLYDAERLLLLYENLIPPEEYADLHVVFTNQLIGTWDDGDRRYHARTIVCGSPCVISTTGLIEAPAKPREYYVIRQQTRMLGMGDAAEAIMDDELASSALLHGDTRLTEVAKGYALQAVAYHLTGKPFCEDSGCRLFNAHWQKDMIYAQIDSPYELCREHSEIFSGI
ncbi:MAG: hypothetical protein HYX78_11050 [Armatimonadetes bacterium]|nr:hypothetical protein [Armatimonadota bacterium]